MIDGQVIKTYVLALKHSLPVVGNKKEIIRLGGHNFYSTVYFVYFDLKDTADFYYHDPQAMFW